MYNCLAATRLLSKAQHKELNSLEKLTVNFHLIFCDSCKSFKSDINYLKLKLSHLDESDNFVLKEDYKKELQRIVLAEINE